MSIILWVISTNCLELLNYQTKWKKMRKMLKVNDNG